MSLLSLSRMLKAAVGIEPLTSWLWDYLCKLQAVLPQHTTQLQQSNAFAKHLLSKAMLRQEFCSLAIYFDLCLF